MDWLLGHRQTKGAVTDNADPKATAPHLDSTTSGNLTKFSSTTAIGGIAALILVIFR